MIRICLMNVLLPDSPVPSHHRRAETVVFNAYIYHTYISYGCVNSDGSRSKTKLRGWQDSLHTRLYACSVGQKILPKVFWHFFPNGWEFLVQIFYTPLHVPIYVRPQIFLQLSPTVTKLCHIKCDHPACVSADDGHFERIWWWSGLIWHNFVNVVDNWIKIGSLV